MITLQMNWAANPPSEQVLSYDVNVLRNGSLVGSFNTPTNSYSLPDPPAGVYSFAVRANNVAGPSAYSAPVQGPGLPSVPTNLVISSVVS